MRLHKYAFQGGGAESVDPPDEPTEYYGRQEWLENLAVIETEEEIDGPTCSSTDMDT